MLTNYIVTVLKEMTKIEHIDEMDNNKLVEFKKTLLYKNIELEFKIEHLKEDIEYNKWIIALIKNEIDERVSNGSMTILNENKESA